MRYSYGAKVETGVENAGVILSGLVGPGWALQLSVVV